MMYTRLLFFAMVGLSAACTLDCGPFGECAIEEEPVTTDLDLVRHDQQLCEGGKCVVQKCVCQDGWAGVDCSMQYEKCRAPLTAIPSKSPLCFNGGNCETFKQKDGTRGMRCNCESATGSAMGSAHPQCEFTGMTICMPHAKNEFAFCVNGGVCRNLGGNHFPCDCPDAYEGRHCQFRTGEAPFEEFVYVNTKGPRVRTVTTAEGLTFKQGRTVFLESFAIAVVLNLCIMFAILVWWRHRQDISPPSTRRLPSTLFAMEIGNSNRTLTIKDMSGSGISSCSSRVIV